MKLKTSLHISAISAGVLVIFVLTNILPFYVKILKEKPTVHWQEQQIFQEPVKDFLRHARKKMPRVKNTNDHRP